MLAGSARAKPRGAELSRAVWCRERQAEPGRPPAAQCGLCGVAGLCVYQPLPRLLQNFYSLGPPGVCEGVGTFCCLRAPCSGDRGDLHPSPAGLSYPEPPHLPITPRSREGAPPKGPRGPGRPELPLAAADPPGTTLTWFLSPSPSTRGCRRRRRRCRRHHHRPRRRCRGFTKGAGRGGGTSGRHRPLGRRGWETKGKLPLLALRV